MDPVSSDNAIDRNQLFDNWMILKKELVEKFFIILIFLVKNNNYEKTLFSVFTFVAIVNMGFASNISNGNDNNEQNKETEQTK